MEIRRLVSWLCRNFPGEAIFRDLAPEDRAWVPVGAAWKPEALTAPVASQFIDVLAQACANGNAGSRAPTNTRLNCQTRHYLQMPVVFAELSANMATLCANGSASLCGELRGGRELGPTCLVPKAPFKDMDSAIICGW